MAADCAVTGDARLGSTELPRLFYGQSSQKGFSQLAGVAGVGCNLIDIRICRTGLLLAGRIGLKLAGQSVTSG